CTRNVPYCISTHCSSYFDYW
nr:immunoglobulin heavy chain junction region [Macaca mulatta]MPN84030.1 immunoglobulin heavy chain junction region [Macaca mulatta]MPN84067.1 immunoglobulin heavy chain junction region [Macaca mulatta]MPN84099.1 immunoglobulin heavy chain junction region [Macaca mulatta]MPN84236.1 immunoglobulin heavy chain junction region [Macaca mulatta]